MGRPAVTLVELLVVLVLLSIVAGVGELAMRRVPPRSEADSVVALIGRARDSAVRSGHTVTVRVVVRGRVALASALPDGRVVPDTLLFVDPLTGRARATP
jgi:prepilin-type N-terminal cleavage/methylation domain-containing protein